MVEQLELPLFGRCTLSLEECRRVTNSNPTDPNRLHKWCLERKIDELVVQYQRGTKTLFRVSKIPQATRPFTRIRDL